MLLVPHRGTGRLLRSFVSSYLCRYQLFSSSPSHYHLDTLSFGSVHHSVLGVGAVDPWLIKNQACLTESKKTSRDRARYTTLLNPTCIDLLVTVEHWTWCLALTSAYCKNRLTNWRSTWSDGQQSEQEVSG